MLFFGPLSLIFEACSLKVILRDLRRITDQPFKYMHKLFKFVQKIRTPVLCSGYNLLFPDNSSFGEFDPGSE